MIFWIKKMSKLLQNVASGISAAASYMAIIITITVSIEVVSRYVFDSPTIWVWPVSRQLFGIFILFALAYTQSKNGHIRIEIFYDHFPRIIKNVLNWFSLMVMLSFTGVLIWQTMVMAIISINEHEKASGAFKIPLYPFKVLLPILSFFIAIEIIISFISNKEKRSD
jgi:TRAP-type C4-dicarboxylate transport system permease small subunit